MPDINLDIFLLLLVGIYALAFYSIIHVLLSYRTAQGAIAWIISLLTFPYITLIAYAIFGRNKFQGYVNARRMGDKELANVLKELDEKSKQLICQPPTHSPELQVLINLVRTPLTRGNHCEVLINGDSSFSAMMNAIDQAEDYILVEFYIVKNDTLGNRLKSHLISKSNEGVPVYFLYDEIGSSGLSGKYIRELEDAGIEITPFGTVYSHLKRLQINFRNHRKILIVDGKKAFIGGMNIGDEYLIKSGDSVPWRDTHLQVEGPAVQGIQLAFVEDWYWAKEHVPPLNWQPTLQEEDQRVLILPTSAADAHDNCELFFLNCINSAKQRIWIATPYFVPDMQLMSALQLASARGVDVRILIPQDPDHRLIYFAAYSYLVQADRYGIGIYRYQKRFMHQKVMLIDNRYASVGTANLDNRSMRLNFEISALIADKDFTCKIERMLSEDFTVSVRMTLKDYQNRSLPFKLLCRAARLLAPVL